MKGLRAIVALLIFGLSFAASAQLPSPRFDELERKLQIRPAQKEQYEMAVGATKRALLAVSLSLMEMKERLAEELMKSRPDFNRLLASADKVFEQHRPLFEEAGREWKKLYALLDDRQVRVAKQFLLDNLGALGVQGFIEEAPKKKREKSPPSGEWI